MATVESYTKDYMQPILDATVVDASVDGSGHLILEHQDGSTSDAGSILPSFALIYPIGSIYLSVLNANPGTLFGGTWVAFGAGRMPIGVATGGDTRWDTAEETGGTETITANMLPTHTHAIGGSSGADAAHTHGVGTLANAAEAAHNHAAGTLGNGTETVAHTHTFSTFHVSAGGTAAAVPENNGNSVTQGPTSGRIEHPVSTTGTVLNNESASHSHVISGSTGTGSSHNHAISGTSAAGSSHSHTMPANTGNNTTTADPLRPPYISVYMWKRTA